MKLLFRNKAYHHIANILTTLFLFFSFPLLFSNSISAQTFKLQPNQTGLSNAYYGNGVAAADYNNDGHIDIYFVSSDPRHPSHPGSANSLFKNNGDGTFTNAAKEAGIEGIIDTTASPQNQLVENFGASWGDFDNDGDVDLYLSNKGVDELYENLGDGTFRNITQSAGLDLLIRDSVNAVWFDLDKDGNLDLYVCGYGKHGLHASSDNIMYRNNGDGTFTDVTAVTRLGEPGFTYTALILDANMDDWPDIYCVNDFGRNVFYLNNSDGTFHEATKEYGLENDGHGMGAAIGDYNNDGLFDIYYTNIGDDINLEWSPLVRHTASGIYEDVSRKSGTAITHWAWGCEFLDFDLDGDLDLYVANGFFGENYGNLLYRNNDDGTFEDISALSGANHQPEARGLCVADFNNDGRLDMVVANLRTTANLYINTTRNGNYLKLNLVGTQSNRDGRGAVVSITASDRTLHRTNDGIELHGQSKVPVHFGLGNETIVDIKVKWPSGIEQEFFTVSAANQSLTITEGMGMEKTIISAVVKNDGPVPDEFSLLDNYPNPILNSTKLRFQCAFSARIKIEIYNLNNHLIATPVEGYFRAGEHGIAWDGADKNGTPLSSGIYILKFSSGNFVAQKKLIKLDNFH